MRPMNPNKREIKPKQNNRNVISLIKLQSLVIYLYEKSTQRKKKLYFNFPVGLNQQKKGIKWNKNCLIIKIGMFTYKFINNPFKLFL